MKKTWGQRCNRLLFFSTANGKNPSIYTERSLLINEPHNAVLRRYGTGNGGDSGRQRRERLVMGQDARSNEIRVGELSS